MDYLHACSKPTDLNDLGQADHNLSGGARIRPYSVAIKFARHHRSSGKTLASTVRLDLSICHVPGINNLV